MRGLLVCSAGLSACLFAAAPALGQCAIEKQILSSGVFGVGNDRFGQSVAIDGGLLLVGAPGDSEVGDESGAAHVFRFVGAQWVHETKLVPISAGDGDGFGRWVALSGVVPVLGSPFEDSFGGSPHSGAAAVFRLRSSDQEWTQDTTLTASDYDSGDEFGGAVAIDGDTIVVGAPGEDTTGTLGGAAYVYEYAELFWQEREKLMPEGPQAFRFFGDSVAVSGNVIAVSAWGDGDMGEAAGAVYVFRRGDEGWGFEAKIYADDAAVGDNFGRRIAINGPRLFVTAPNAIGVNGSVGAVYVFRQFLSEDGPVWVQQQKYLPDDGATGQQFGLSVAAHGTTALVGSSFQDPNDPNTVEYRFAHVLAYQSGAWAERDRFEASDFEPGDVYGFNLALDAGVAVVGSFQRGGGGSAYVYDVLGCGGCAGDVDGDGAVTLTDLATLLANFGLSGGVTPSGGDMDGDGDADLTDLSILLINFGNDCFL